MDVIRRLLEITLRFAQVVEKALLEAPDFRALEVAVVQEDAGGPCGSFWSRPWKRWTGS